MLATALILRIERTCGYTPLRRKHLLEIMSFNLFHAMVHMYIPLQNIFIWMRPRGNLYHICKLSSSCLTITMMTLMTQSIPTMGIHTGALVIVPSIQPDINDFSFKKLLNFIIVSSERASLCICVCVCLYRPSKWYIPDIGANCIARETKRAMCVCVGMAHDAVVPSTHQSTDCI